MFLLFTLIILAPNSTPIVTSCLIRKRLSINYVNKQDFPTPIFYYFLFFLPVSPIIMYLKRYAYDIIVYFIFLWSI